MSRPQTQTDEDLLAAVRDVLLEDVRASLRTIGTRIGMSHAGLLKRFGSRDDLVVAALGPGARHPRDRFVDGPDERPLVEQLVAISSAAEANLGRTLPNVLALQAAGFDAGAIYSIEGRPTPEVTHGRMVAWLRRATAQGRLLPCDLESLAVALSGLVLARPLWASAYGPLPPALDPERYLTTAVALLLDGLLPPETTMPSLDPQTATDVATRIFDHLESCWNAHDGAGYAEVFTDDADFVDIRGARHIGRQAIGAGHDYIFEHFYKGSRADFGFEAARPVHGTIVAHGTNHLAHPGGELDGKRSLHTVVIVPEGDDWKVAAFHNTVVA